MAARAAFLKESRMKIVEPAGFKRKSGIGRPLVRGQRDNKGWCGCSPSGSDTGLAKSCGSVGLRRHYGTDLRIGPARLSGFEMACKLLLESRIGFDREDQAVPAGELLQ